MTSTVSQQLDQKSRGLGKGNKEEASYCLAKQVLPHPPLCTQLLREALPVQRLMPCWPLPQASAPCCLTWSCQPLRWFVHTQLSHQLLTQDGEKAMGLLPGTSWLLLEPGTLQEADPQEWCNGILLPHMYVSWSQAMCVFCRSQCHSPGAYSGTQNTWEGQFKTD